MTTIQMPWQRIRVALHFPVPDPLQWHLDQEPESEGLPARDSETPPTPQPRMQLRPRKAAKLN